MNTIEQAQALAADLRTRINLAYADQLGTESYERRLCAEAIEGLEAELERRNAALRLMTTSSGANWNGWKSAEAELAKLKEVALSDDGAGGEGLMLYIRNRELNAELASIKGQKPVGMKAENTALGNPIVWWADVPTGSSLYLAAGAQPEVVKWGVDWGTHGDRSCVSIVKQHIDGTLEVVATEYQPTAGAQPKGTQNVRTPAGYTFEDARRDGVFGPAHDICPTWYATTLRKEGWDAASSAAKEQQRNPLTDELISDLYHNSSDSFAFARAIEAAHDIKEQP